MVQFAAGLAQVTSLACRHENELCMGKNEIMKIWFLNVTRLGPWVPFCAFAAMMAAVGGPTDDPVTCCLKWWQCSDDEGSWL